MTDMTQEAKWLAQTTAVGGELDIRFPMSAKLVRTILTHGFAPPGFALVPVEPTEAMEIAGAVARDFDAVKMPSRQRAAATYRAMLAAHQKEPLHD